MENNYITVKELMEYTGMSRTMAYQFVNQDKNPVVLRAGRKILIDKRKLDEILQYCSRRGINLMDISKIKIFSKL